MYLGLNCALYAAGWYVRNISTGEAFPYIVDTCTQAPKEKMFRCLDRACNI